MLDFYKDKRVFITGHTGFKGTWLSLMLINAGAIVTGYSLSAHTNPNVFSLSHIESDMTSVIGDIRDKDKLTATFNAAKPEIVFHLAAQPIVRDSYKDPVYTYETNVMGTVNILECIRNSDCVRSFLNVTTDKVYKNREWEWGYRENEMLDGFDPYSNSKSCSEIITHSYKSSFLEDKGISVSTARAGNVIGGGDFANDRIIPDCIRAIEKGSDIVVRNPYSTRPYQHVLEPITAYLMIAEKQYDNMTFSDWYNVGPDDCDCVTTGELVTLLCDKWNKIKWHSEWVGGAHEATFLKLDCSKIKKMFGWKPTWHIGEAIDRTLDWTRVYLDKGNVRTAMNEQINAFLNESSLDL